MNKVCSYLARRQREINIKGKPTIVREVSFIPSGADFPAVLKVTPQVYEDLSRLSVAEQFEISIIEVPPFGEMFGIEIKQV